MTTQRKSWHGEAIVDAREARTDWKTLAHIDTTTLVEVHSTPDARIKSACISPPSNILWSATHSTAQWPNSASAITNCRRSIAIFSTPPNSVSPSRAPINGLKLKLLFPKSSALFCKNFPPLPAKTKVELTLR